MIYENHMIMYPEKIDYLLKKFSSIPLHEISSESQMSRFDNKYLFSSLQLPEILTKMTEHYYVLEVKKQRILNYKSNYFDTDTFEMYMAHHNGKMNRYKIRYREYLESGDKFLEIKHKDNRRFTTKLRIPVVNIDLIETVQSEFINQNSIYYSKELHPSLQTSYKRITFINKSQEKRITIDYSISFVLSDKSLFISGIAIAEIKNLDRNPSSRFNRILDSYGIKKCSFSKYAVGISLLKNDIKKNRFKEKLSKIHNLQNEFNKHISIEHAQ